MERITIATFATDLKSQNDITQETLNHIFEALDNRNYHSAINYIKDFI